jgi:hypothetical protein
MPWQACRHPSEVILSSPAGRRSANAAHFDQVKTEKPDSLEHAMQAGLVELSPDARNCRVRIAHPDEVRLPRQLMAGRPG